MRMTFRQLHEAQRTAWTAGLIRQVQAGLTFERFFPSPEYLPVPWYGRVRHWLARWPFRVSAVLEDWSLSMNRLGDAVDYHARVKWPSRPNVGQTVQFRRYAPLTIEHDPDCKHDG